DALVCKHFDFFLGLTRTCKKRPTRKSRCRGTRTQTQRQAASLSDTFLFRCLFPAAQKKKMTTNKNGVAYSAVGSEGVGGMQSLQVSAADELDSLDDRHGSIGRLMRNPKIMWIVIVLLAVLLILVIGLWAWTANHQVQIDNNEPCPTDGVGGLFENLFQDWVANVALYLIHGRYTCSATSAAFYAEELR